MTKNNQTSKTPIRNKYERAIADDKDIMSSIVHVRKVSGDAYNYYCRVEKKYHNRMRGEHALICGRKLANALTAAYYDGVRNGCYLRRGAVWEMVRQAIEEVCAND